MSMTIESSVAKLGALKNTEAEYALLSCMVFKNAIVPDVMSRVESTDFYSQTNRLLFNAIAELYNTDVAIDYVTFVDHLKHKGVMDKVGGPAAVMRVIETEFTANNYEHYVDIILVYSKRRKMLELAEKIANRAVELSDEVSLDDIKAEIAELAINKPNDVRTMQEEILDFLAEFDRRRKDPNGGVQSGFDCLDRKTLGWKPSQLIILAARPAMGKTAFALNVAVNAAMNGKSVAIFSLEMPKYDLIARMVAYMKNVPISSFQLPSEMTEQDYGNAYLALDTLLKYNLHLFDKNVATPNDIIATCKAVQGKYGLDLVIIDYLQLLTSGGKYEGNRVQEISYISRQLKMLAQNMGIPVIALSQLSRAVETRDDKRPRLSDLRESGSIEQDADEVLMLYREGAYNPNTTDKSSELIIAKNRNGELGAVRLQYHGLFTKFSPGDGFYAGHDVPSSSIPY